MHKDKLQPQHIASPWRPGALGCSLDCSPRNEPFTCQIQQGHQTLHKGCKLNRTILDNPSVTATVFHSSDPSGNLHVAVNNAFAAGKSQSWRSHHHSGTIYGSLAAVRNPPLGLTPHTDWEQGSPPPAYTQAVFAWTHSFLKTATKILAGYWK